VATFRFWCCLFCVGIVTEVCGFKFYVGVCVDPRATGDLLLPVSGLCGDCDVNSVRGCQCEGLV
jgi:hypothetical protein